MKLEKQAYNLGRVYRILEDNDNALAHNDVIRDQAPAKPVAALEALLEFAWLIAQSLKVWKLSL